jgi:hypothetical protein
MMISATRKIAFRALLAFVAALLPAHAEDELHFVTDQASHCSLGTFATGLHPTVQWTGACVNGKAEGLVLRSGKTRRAFGNVQRPRFMPVLPKDAA